MTNKLTEIRAKRAQITENYFDKQGIKSNPTYLSDATNNNLFVNKDSLAFYDPVTIDTETGEKLLLLLVNPVKAMGMGMTDTERYSIMRNIGDYDKIDAIKSNLIVNPITFAIQDTVLADDSSLESNQQFRDSVLNMQTGVRHNTDRIDISRNDTHTLYKNDDIYNVLTKSYDGDKIELSLPLVMDIHGNTFFLQPSFEYLDISLNNVSELIAVGLIEYMDTREEDLPILAKYLNDRGIAKFDVSNIKEQSIDIRNSEEFYKEFSETFDSVRVKSKYKYNRDKSSVSDAFHRRKSEGGISRFNDEDDNNFIILPKTDQFSRDKRTMDIITGRRLNDLTVDNMYSFINETNKIYYVGNRHNVKPVNGVGRSDLFLYDMIRNDAMTVTIELYLYNLYAKANHIELYHEFTIRGNGGKGKKRVINAPNDELKAISKKMNKILTRSVDRTVVNKELDDVMIGYRKGKNIQDNALVHADNKSIIKADFSGYFDSIKLEYCYDIFKFLSRPSRVVYSADSKKPIQPNQLESRYADEIHDMFNDTFFNPKSGGLYMGNPVSGALSNLVIMKVVKYINNICLNKDIAFSIYADDLTFSIKNYNKEDSRVLNKEYIEYIINHALETFNMDMDLKINPEKTMRMNNQKRRITGIRLNDTNELTWDRYKYRELRVIFHKLSMGVPISELSMNKNQLKGNINFFKYTENRNADQTRIIDVEDSKISRLMDKYKDTLLENGILSKKEYNSMFYPTQNGGNEE